MISRFFSYYRPHKKLFMLDFSFAILVGLLELGFPLAVQWFIDDLLPGGEWNWNYHRQHRSIDPIHIGHDDAVRCQLLGAQARD